MPTLAYLYHFRNEGGGTMKHDNETKLSVADVDYWTTADGLDVSTLSLPEAAAHYASLGLRVFPIKPGCKKPPLVKDWPNVATTNPTQVAEWWGRWPEANIAIATGDVFDVLDFDNDEAWQTYQPDDARADGFTVRGVIRTPRGWHMCIQATGLGNRVAVSPNIDYRGIGGYIMAPPSVIVARGDHPGGTYRRVADESGFGTTGASLRQAIMRPMPEPNEPVAPAEGVDVALNAAWGAAVLAGEIERVREAKRDTRNDTLNKATWRLGQAHAAGGFTFDEAEARLLDACDANGLLEEDGRDACSATIRSGWKAGASRPRGPGALAAMTDTSTTGGGESVVAELSRIDGADLFDEVERFLARYVAYPGEHERVAHTLWIGHAWLIDRWESTPRIAFLSPEPGSGKSRALEITEPLVPRPVHAVNVSPAYLFRKVSDSMGPPTILFDEIDTVFGPRAKENEELRGLLNSGHRQGAVAGRCVVRGATVITEELPAYAAVALAGLNDLPDTIMTRSVVVRMRRRAPGEQVEPWRQRTGRIETGPLHDRLESWANKVRDQVGKEWPVMPEGVEDRNADVWEALLAVADMAGGQWPVRARAAAVAMVADATDRPPSLGVLLLRDLRRVFNDTDTDRMSTTSLVAALVALDESPWGELKGKEIGARGLASLLNQYGIKSRTMRIAKEPVKGYAAADMADAWERYLPPWSPQEPVTLVTQAEPEANEPPVQADVSGPGLALSESSPGRNRVTDVTDLSGSEGGVQ